MAAPQNYVSVSRRALDVEDYIDMLRRYRSWIVGPMFAGLVISVVVAFLWPDTYISYAVMRIDPQTVSSQLVPSAVSMQMAQRLEGFSAELRSRTTLGGLIVDPNFHLYQKLRNRAPLEDAIDQMQKDVKIIPLEAEASGERRYTTFRIQFSYSDRLMARAVVNNLVSHLTSQSVSQQKLNFDNTSDFMKSEVDNAQATLQAAQDALSKFKLENQGKLPENSSSNGIMMANLQMRLGQAGEHLSQMQQQKNSLQTNLNSLNDTRTILSQAEEATAASQAVKSTGLINLDNQIHGTEMLLAAHQEQYTDQNPVVQSDQAQLKVLRALREKEQAKLDADQGAPPDAAQPKKGLTLGQKAAVSNVASNIAAVKTQIQNVEMSIKDITAEKSDLDAQLKELRQRIDSSPVVEQKNAQLQQELTLAKERYDDVKKRQEMAGTAKNLDEHEMGERLDTLDPANVPEKPAEPNRYEIAAAGIGLGLMAGLALAGAKEAKDTSLKNLKDVRAYTNLPVLSSIPLLENGLLVRRKRRLFWLAWTSAVMVGVAAMAAAMYYYFTPHAG
jgi:polysaccharide chain length determinant protein (PEP-CTERM system associated)